MTKRICVLTLIAALGWTASATATECEQCAPRLDPRAAEFRKQSADVRRYMRAGVTAALGVGVLLGLGKVYFVWRRWQSDNVRERPPWDRTT